METGLVVGDAMTHRPINIPPNLTIQECAKIMADKVIGSLLVTEDEQILGIVTEQDLVRKAMTKGLDVTKTMVAQIMTDRLITIGPADDIFKAIMLMRDHDIRHLPVLEDDRLVGFLTVKDVLKVEPALFDNLLDVMELREEERKLAMRPHSGREGFCEVCGNFSERLARGSEQRLVCPDCRD